MTFDKFSDIIERLKRHSEIVNQAYSLKIDLIDFSDDLHRIIDDLVREIYGETGYDWFSWFCYENEYGSRGFEAWDENKNLICQSFESLWEYLEKIKPEKK
jgi:hypothetical protein